MQPESKRSKSSLNTELDKKSSEDNKEKENVDVSKETGKYQETSFI